MELIQDLWKASWRREAISMSLKYFGREEREVYLHLPRMIS